MTPLIPVRDPLQSGPPTPPAPPPPPPHDPARPGQPDPPDPRVRRLSGLAGPDESVGWPARPAPERRRPAARHHNTQPSSRRPRREHTHGCDAMARTRNLEAVRPAPGPRPPPRPGQPRDQGPAPPPTPARAERPGRHPPSQSRRQGRRQGQRNGRNRCQRSPICRLTQRCASNSPGRLHPREPPLHDVFERLYEYYPRAVPEARGSRRARSVASPSRAAFSAINKSTQKHEMRI